MRPDRSAKPARRAAAAAAGLLVALLSPAGGCGIVGAVTPNIRSLDPAEKIPGMKQAAQRRDPSALPELVASLNSDDPAVRMYAIGALGRYTDQTFGYHYFEDADARAPAVQRWKEWLAAQGSKK